MCQDSQTARTVDLAPGVLAEMGLEHPDYWDGTYEQNVDDRLDRGERL